MSWNSKKRFGFWKVPDEGKFKISMMHLILNPIHYHFSFYALGPLCVGSLMAVFGIAVRIRERGSTESSAFLGMLISGAVWLIGYGMAYLAKHEFAALWWVKVGHIGVCLIPSTIFLFALTIVKRAPAFRLYIWASFLFSALFIFEIIATDQFISGLYSYFWGYYAHYSRVSIIFLFFFGTMLLAALRILWLSYRQASSLWQRSRIKCFLVAFCISYLGSLDYFPAFGLGFYPAGYLPVFAYVLITAWTIKRYHLVDITPAFAAQQIIDNMADALLVLDRDGIVRVANTVASRLFRRPSKSLVGKHIIEATNGVILADTFEKLIPGNKLQDYEIILPGEAESETVLSLSSSLLCGDDKQPAAFVCLFRDITEAKKIITERQIHAEAVERANRELMEKEKIMLSLLEDLQASHQKLAQLAAIVESSEDAIISEMLDGTILSWNKGAEKIYGYTAEEMIGRPIFILSDPNSPHEIENILQKLKQGEKIAHHEMIRIRKDGRGIDVFLTFSPVKNEKGDILGVSAISRDITQQKRTRELLRRNEEQTRLIIETANDAFIAMDAKGLITAWNSKAEQIFGWKRVEVIEKSLAETIIPGPLREAHQNGFQHFLKTGRGPIINKQVELTALHRDGHEFPVELTVWPLQLGETTQFNAFIRDITERKAADAALLEKTRQFARAEAERESLELFAFAASHDLQAPLQKIIAFADMMKSRQTQLDATGRDYLERMQNAAFRMGQLIQSLLNFSRTTTDTGPVEEASLGPLIRDVLADLEVKVRQTEAVIDVGELPAVRINKVQTQEVFQNLLVNAMKFHKPGEKPRITIESLPPEDGLVIVIVRDNGIGFDEKHLAEIFKPFKRLHGNHEYEGSGMGLAICQKIILRQGGQLTARSEPGKGSSFIVKLPFTRPEKSARETEIPERFAE